MTRQSLETTLDPADYSFTHHLRTRFAETDAMGIIHHAAYLPYLEEARVEYLRAIGHPYDAVRGGEQEDPRALCEHLELTQVDVVVNDTGGAVAQVFAAHYPGRIRTLTLTNCDVHDNFPPEAFKPFVDLAESGEFGPMVAAMAADPALARSEVGFGMGYAHPERLSDELLASYLGAFVTDQGKGLERLLTASSSADLMAVAPLLAELRAPTLVAWGTGDSFFVEEWADRLESMIPGVERVILVPDAMLFWPDERAADLVPLLRDFWGAHA